MIAIDAKFFSEIVRKLPDSDVIIETDESLQTTIVCEKAKFNISGKPGDEFSYLPIIEKDESIEVSQFTLKEVIRQTIFSIADSDSNKLMTGELFEIKNNMLRVVSLDGHRISIRKIALDADVTDKKLVVPGKTLDVYKRQCVQQMSDITEQFVHCYFQLFSISIHTDMFRII